MTAFKFYINELDKTLYLVNESPVYCEKCKNVINDIGFIYIIQYKEGIKSFISCVNCNQKEITEKFFGYFFSRDSFIYETEKPFDTVPYFFSFGLKEGMLSLHDQILMRGGEGTTTDKTFIAGRGESIKGAKIGTLDYQKESTKELQEKDVDKFLKLQLDSKPVQREGIKLIEGVKK